jgi:hypothetical protein
MQQFFPRLTVGLAVLLLVAAGFLLAGCGEQEPRDAVVEDLRLVREHNGDQVLQGALVNTAGKHIRGARISVDLYAGGDSELADTMSIEVRDIDPGARKTFRHEIDTGSYLSGARISQIVLF